MLYSSQNGLGRSRWLPNGGIIRRTARNAAAALVLILGARSPMQGQMHGQMHGMMGKGQRDMQAIHALFDSHQKIKRTVQNLENGVETVTESDDAEVQALLREHVGAMYRRLAAKQPIRMWDPLYAEIFKRADKIKMELVNTPKGVKVTETSSDPWVVQLLQAHAKGVSGFVEEGMAAMHREHPLPAAAMKENTMQILALRTEVGEGNDKQIDTLFDGPRRKIFQITLRNGATLDAHKVPMPITIQCVAGSGTLKVANAGVVELKPGALVTIEPDTMHEVTGQPSVSILLTQFSGR